MAFAPLTSMRQPQPSAPGTSGPAPALSLSQAARHGLQSSSEPQGTPVPLLSPSLPDTRIGQKSQPVQPWPQSRVTVCQPEQTNQCFFRSWSKALCPKPSSSSPSQEWPVKQTRQTLPGSQQALGGAGICAGLTPTLLIISASFSCLLNVAPHSKTVSHVGHGRARVVGGVAVRRGAGPALSTLSASSPSDETRSPSPCCLAACWPHEPQSNSRRKGARRPPPVRQMCTQLEGHHGGPSC